jgi:hypothetical protein
MNKASFSIRMVVQVFYTVMQSRQKRNNWKAAYNYVRKFLRMLILNITRMIEYFL